MVYYLYKKDEQGNYVKEYIDEERYLAEKVKTIDNRYTSLKDAIYLQGVGYVKREHRDKYKYCNQCGNYYLIKEENYSDNFCDSCFKRKSKEIYNYHGFRDIKFRKTVYDKEEKPLYFGIELEVNRDRDRENKYLKLNRVANKVKKNLNYDISCNRDSSIANEGFEIVTNPMTLRYISKKESEFRTMFNTLKDNGFRPGDSCGYHIHVSKNYLGNTAEEIDNTIDNILLITENFRDELVKFSRRKKSCLNNYSRFLLDSDTRKFDLNMKTIKDKKKSYNRYVVVNLRNTNTVEFRLFKTTMDYTIFMAAIELVNNIVNIAKDKSKDDLIGLSWCKLLSYKETKYLKDYCKTIELTSRNKIKECYFTDDMVDKLLMKVIKKDIKISETYRKELNKVIKEICKFSKSFLKDYYKKLQNIRNNELNSIIKNKFYNEQENEVIDHTILEIKKEIDKIEKLINAGISVKRVYVCKDVNYKVDYMIRFSCYKHIMDFYYRMNNYINNNSFTLSQEENRRLYIDDLYCKNNSMVSIRETIYGVIDKPDSIMQKPIITKES